VTKEPPLEPVRRILGQGVDDIFAVAGKDGHTKIVLRDPAAESLLIHVRISALHAAVAGGGISETSARTCEVAAEYEKWIMRGITE
jgi:hypothetical protein